MYERSTDDRRSTYEDKEVYPAGEVKGPQGMGDERKRGRCCEEVRYSSSYALQVEKGLGAGSRNLSKRKTSQSGSEDKKAGRGEPETDGSPCHTDTGINVAKKKDELGLTNRIKGTNYSIQQRERIIEEVERLKSFGISKTKALKELGVCRSVYYGWMRCKNSIERRKSLSSLTESERDAVIKKKRSEPYLSHRKISGYLRNEGYWISESSCYRILKELDWIFTQPLREAPWKTPRYEPFAPNQVWGEDWTILSIGGLRHYLLTIIDYFSRYVVAWDIVKTVSQREVKDLLVMAYMNEGIEDMDQKPILRMDQGSPNMAYGTRRLIRDLEMVISPSRANRPTDNARQERWYRTIKQEEIYCFRDYPDIVIARRSIGKYVREYNELRPHQALWNFTPAFVHRVGNKTKLLEYKRRMVQIVKEQRIRTNRKLTSLVDGGVPRYDISQK